MPLRCAQISSCSTAAARKVSAAQRITLKPSLRRRFASLPMLVVFPAPLTPTIKMTRGPLPLVDPATCAGSVGFEAAFRMRTMCDLISVLSCEASESALRSSFSRTASKISRVVLTPRSADSKAFSSCLSSAGSTFFSPRKIVSTVSDSAALVLLTLALRRSASVGSGLPKREIMGLRAQCGAVEKCSRRAELTPRTRDLTRQSVS